MNMHRRQWITAMAAGGLALSQTRLALAERPGESAAATDALLRLAVRPGCLYELHLAQPDSVPVGTRWQGEILPAAGPKNTGSSSGPATKAARCCHVPSLPRS